METLECIKARRSIRGYKPDPVDQELVDKVIEAGLYAASGMNRQASVIIQVKDPALRKAIAAENARIMGAKEGTDPFYGAPVVLIVLADAERPTAVYDGSLTLGSMMLEAKELGLGSCWIHRAKEEFEEDFGKDILKRAGITGNYIGVGHLALGYPAAEEPKAPARREGRVYSV